MSWPPALRRTVGAACLLLGAGPAAGSSYLLSEGELAYRAVLGRTQASAAWDADGTLADLGCTSQRTTFDHALEWGQSYWHTLFGHVALAQSRCGERTRQGVGDLTVGARGRLARYQNYRAWELDATVPVQRGADAVGCGAYGIGGALERTDRNPYAALSYGAALQLWQAPLAHRLKLQVQAGGPLGLHGITPWAWQLGLTAEAPLVDRPEDPQARLNDCGTQARQLRAGTGLRYHWSRGVTVGCSMDATLAGADVNRSLGFSCGFARLWD